MDSADPDRADPVWSSDPPEAILSVSDPVDHQSITPEEAIVDQVGGAGATPCSASGGEPVHPDLVFVLASWTLDSVKSRSIGHTVGSDDLQGSGAHPSGVNLIKTF